jgi:histidinol-phosphatase (PHP family)
MSSRTYVEYADEIELYVGLEIDYLTKRAIRRLPVHGATLVIVSVRCIYYTMPLVRWSLLIAVGVFKERVDRHFNGDVLRVSACISIAFSEWLNWVLRYFGAC